MLSRKAKIGSDVFLAVVRRMCRTLTDRTLGWVKALPFAIEKNAYADSASLSLEHINRAVRQCKTHGNSGRIAVSGSKNVVFRTQLAEVLDGTDLGAFASLLSLDFEVADELDEFIPPPTVYASREMRLGLSIDSKELQAQADERSAFVEGSGGDVKVDNHPADGRADGSVKNASAIDRNDCLKSYALEVPTPQLVGGLTSVS